MVTIVRQLRVFLILRHRAHGCGRNREPFKDLGQIPDFGRNLIIHLGYGCNTDYEIPTYDFNENVLDGLS